jgi:hypothetical protein
MPTERRSSAYAEVRMPTLLLDEAEADADVRVRVRVRVRVLVVTGSPRLDGRLCFSAGEVLAEMVATGDRGRPGRPEVGGSGGTTDRSGS